MYLTEQLPIRLPDLNLSGPTIYLVSCSIVQQASRNLFPRQVDHRQSSTGYSFPSSRLAGSRSTFARRRQLHPPRKIYIHAILDFAIFMTLAGIPLDWKRTRALEITETSYFISPDGNLPVRVLKPCYVCVTFVVSKSCWQTMPLDASSAGVGIHSLPIRP
jgi:hypothetical protein